MIGAFVGLVVVVVDRLKEGLDVGPMVGRSVGAGHRRRKIRCLWQRRCGVTRICSVSDW